MEEIEKIVSADKSGLKFLVKLKSERAGEQGGSEAEGGWAGRRDHMPVHGACSECVQAPDWHLARGRFQPLGTRSGSPGQGGATVAHAGRAWECCKSSSPDCSALS